MSQQIYCRTMEEAQDMAASAAISQGYDQVVYQKPKKGYSFIRTTSYPPKKIICYVRLCYKEGVLCTRLCDC